MLSVESSKTREDYPHWLDNFFQDHESFDNLVNSDKFKAAFIKAKAAFVEHERFMKENPDVYGASPAQKARLAFLDELNQAR